jgi:hypothetical protein
LVGTTWVNAEFGVATFVDLGATRVKCSYQLAFGAIGSPSTGALIDAVQAMTASAGVASVVTVTQSPSGLSNGIAFTTQPQVKVQDCAGSTVTSSTALVTASISDGGAFIGSVTASAVSGIASFADLGITGIADATYAVTFAAPELSPFKTMCTIAYCVGSTGPSGGIVFYIAETTFTSLGSVCDTTCKYLEAAPTGWGNGIGDVTLGETPGTPSVDPKLMWCSNTTNHRNSYLEFSFGWGQQYTSAGTRAGWQPCTSGAIFHAGNYSVSVYTDWFLPSSSELFQLCRFARNLPVGGNSCGAEMNGAIRNGFTTTSYWSSSDGLDPTRAQYGSFNGNGGARGPKTLTLSVRPVRVFG